MARLDIKRAVSEIRQLNAFLQACFRGIESVEELLSSDGRIDPAERLARKALIKVTKHGRPCARSVVVVRLWSILGSTIGSFIGNYILTDGHGWDDVVVEALKQSFIESGELSETTTAEDLYRLLKNKLGGSQSGVAGFERCLAAIGLDGPVDKLVKRFLLELTEARDAVANRNGMADEKFMTSWPWAAQEKGTNTHIRRDWVAVAITATVTYLLEIDRRALLVVGRIQNEHRHRLQSKLSCWLWEVFGEMEEVEVVPKPFKTLSQEQKMRLFSPLAAQIAYLTQQELPEEIVGDQILELHYLEDTRWIDEEPFRRV